MDIAASYKARVSATGVSACSLAVKIDNAPSKVKQKNRISS
jgi:hypothetical protein